MTTIQLHIPDDLAGKMAMLTSNAETFILDLIRSQIKDFDKKTTLADEYHLASIENETIRKDFSLVDLENWDDEY